MRCGLGRCETASPILKYYQDFGGLSSNFPAPAADTSRVPLAWVCPLRHFKAPLFCLAWAFRIGFWQNSGCAAPAPPAFFALLFRSQPQLFAAKVRDSSIKNLGILTTPLPA